MRQAKSTRLSGYTILLVDDNPEYLEATRILLEHEGHDVVCAADGQSALDILRRRRVDLALLDYFMPGITGEEVVAQLRRFNSYVQVILQTGYASEQPPRELLRRLDIQGYYDKNEGPEKLLMWTDAGLKAASAIKTLNKSRQGLRYLLDATSSLHKIRPLSELLQGLLYQVAELLGADDSFVGVYPQGEIRDAGAAPVESSAATTEDDKELIVKAGTGRFSEWAMAVGPLEDGMAGAIAETLRNGRIRILEEATVVPLRVGETILGAIYLDRPAVLEDDVELLQIFANQAAVAIQNSQLYALATLDSLTGAYGRGLFDTWLLRELRSAFRFREPLALLMVDLNAMKRINDTAGHLAGDQALSTVGKVLKQATRTTDIVGRYGGDEFALVLPRSEAQGAGIVARRILSLLEGRSVPVPGGAIPLSVSIGLGTLTAPVPTSVGLSRRMSEAYFQRIGQELVKRADEALYRAKKDEENRFYQGEPTTWLAASEAVQAEPGES
jgi:diguanylate cyclase (GGDEF)-like protein